MGIKGIEGKGDVISLQIDHASDSICIESGITTLTNQCLIGLI